VSARLICGRCGKKFPIDFQNDSCSCGGLLTVALTRPKESASRLKRVFEDRRGGLNRIDASGVWRFRELMPPFRAGDIVTRPEGNTPIYSHVRLSDYAGISRFTVKHEGENPTGSFKDRGMTVAISRAKRKKARAVACASTGNTSASLASYAALANLTAIAFVPSGKITAGKMSQALAYGAKTLLLPGDFDTAMKFVREVCASLHIELVNSINPFRLEGQKTVMWELLEQYSYESPDWIVLPAGNLGNVSAFGKALREAKEWGFIRKLPRLAAVQAEGASPFFQSFQEGFQRKISVQARTIATAVQIGNPVSFDRAVEAIRSTNGTVTSVTDDEILEAKSVIDAAGIGCEPASACALAGTRKLVQKGIIRSKERVVGILTGNLLKDPDTTISFHSGKFSDTDPGHVNRPIEISLEIGSVERVLKGD
jgi:threonine synthase